MSHPAGPMHPTYRHGLYSSALPAHLKEIAAQSAADENNLALNEAIGALDARIVELMGGLSRDAGGRQAWRDMRMLIDALEEAHDTENVYLFKQTMNKAKGILAQEFREFTIWEEIYNGFEVRRRLVETETKRREKAANQIGLEQVMTLTHQIAIVLRRHITDPQMLRLIAIDINALMNSSVGSPLINQSVALNG